MKTKRLRTALTLVLLATCLVVGPGCMSMTHTVGAGATGGEEDSISQWYAFWGFWHIGGAADTATLARDRVNYTVTTCYSTWDVMLNLLIFPVGFHRSSLRIDY